MRASRPLVPRGAPIAVVAPASAFDPERLDAGLTLLRAMGYDPRPLPGLLAPVRSLAASDETRLAHLTAALADPEWAAVWAVRGGFGLTRILDRLPWERLPARPILGFSDLTPLLDAAAARLGSDAIHGPVVHSLPTTDEASIEWLDRLLQGAPLPPLPGEVWVEGRGEGPLVGGNLCMLAATCGTPFQVDTRGAILVIEEIGEAAYRVDRLLTQLRGAGLLDALAGVAVGELLGCDAPPGAGWAVTDVLRDHLLGLGVPVLTGLPIGHGPANRAFRVRGPGRIAAGALHLQTG